MNLNIAEFTHADIAAIRNVLARKTSLKFVAEHYNLKRATLVGITILIAANQTSFPYGFFGPQLRRLVVEPAIPVHGWPRTKHGRQDVPEWCIKKSNDKLLNASRTYGGHSSTEYAVIEINLIPQLVALLNEDINYRITAQALYANPNIELTEAGKVTNLDINAGIATTSTGPAKTDPNLIRRNANLREAVARSSILGHIMQLSTDSRVDRLTLDDWRNVQQVLGRLINEHHAT